ncbi:hypothetical protein [Marinibactrum halimedae]|uniref:Uncharacterized protein n=1 Tax=Marinibactrum halimedae TaxID=1444977 RepID=A0AA37WPR7_9GAMM|nr:hypothetical protein [Marinibactrum halimedae]MCD9458547.1 hypothetical protein [Marinibactrum halimedae]GLS26587.1 hypothetical protein GCM10007877_23030 [Marinibactrum halimedae]
MSTKTLKNKALLENFFNSSERATVTTILLFLLFILMYLFFQVAQGTTVERCKMGIKLKELTPCTQLTPPIIFYKDGLLEYEIHETVLEKFYDSQSVEEFIEDFEHKASQEKNILLDKRAYFFRQASRAISPHYVNKPMPINIPILDTFTSEQGRKVFEEMKLNNFLAKIALLKKDVQLNWTNSESNLYLIQLDDLQIDIKSLIQRQEASAKLLEERIETLKPQLNFLWLYHPGSGWIVELVFWSLFGLCCCTLVNNIRDVRNNEYNAKRYTLFFPRIFLAPIMSVVVVALISSGYMEYNSNLNNFPYFLALAFFLGFNSESLNAIIQNTSNKLLQPLAFSKEKMLAANKKIRYLPKFQDELKNVRPTSATMSEIRDHAKVRIKPESEKQVLKMYAKESE